jgi:outer membrane protein assembly factor BamB
MNLDVVTRSYDFARTGANTAETGFTPALVKTRGIKTLLTLLTPDDPRLEAQPLYLSAINVRGKTRNVIYQATMGNTVYAWDADTGELLWKTNLGTPINGSQAIDAHNINIKWGILSTPVIDRLAGVLYACAWISPDRSGNWQTGEHVVAALDITTGVLKEGKPLLSLEGATFDPGQRLPVLQFKSAERKQRAALAIVSGAVIIGFGTIAESAKSARGWLIAVDTAKWSIAATWCSTARGSGGGIWMSGAGPAIQSDGSIWVVTGNGAFDGKVDFGESVVRLRYSPATGTSKATFKMTGWWTPWTDEGRTGGHPDAEAGTGPAAKTLNLSAQPRPSNFRIVPHLARLGVQAKDMGGAWSDQDLGASGITLVEASGAGLVSGKDGILYTIDLNDPGETAPANLAPTAALANYAKLAAPPILYTYYDPSMNPATPNPATLNRLPGNVTHHLHGTPVYWQSAAHGQLHFCGGENGNLRAWAIGPSKSSAYLGCSAAVASAQAPIPPGGMAGWNITLSANGNTNGIVWAMIPYGDANMILTRGRFLAYDAVNLGRFADGSGEIVPLWDSQDWGWDFLHPKFNRPIAVGGKVIVPTYDGRVLVLGLA